MKDILILDADGLLLSYISGVIKFLKHKGLGYSHLLDGDTEANNLKPIIAATGYFMPEDIYINKSEEEAMALHNEFLSSEFIGDMDIFDDYAKEVMANLADRYTLIVLTCIGRKSHTKNMRRKNLVNVYGDIFAAIFCLDFNESKYDMLDFIKNTYDCNIAGFIDDNPQHIMEGIKAGVKTYAYSFKNPFDLSGFPDDKILENFADIEKKLLKVAA